MNLRTLRTCGKSGVLTCDRVPRPRCSAPLLALAAAAGAALLVHVSAASAADGPYQHVLVISIDGMHQDDLADPALASVMPNILNFADSGIRYTNAHSVTPS